MTRLSMMVVIWMVLAGCSREAPQVQTVPLPEPAADLVAELARDPDRLKEIRRLCREDRGNVAEELCIASAIATRQRFMGEGKARYTPEPADLPDAELPEPRDE